MLANQYHFQGETLIPSPQMIYYLDEILSNTRHAIEEAGGADRLWPHVKTHKMENMIRLQLSMGIRRFKCATIAEAEMVASCGADAVILAYPLVGPNIQRFLALRDAYPQTLFYAIGDDLEQFRKLSVAAASLVPILIDVDPGFHRTGVALDSLYDFYHEVSRLPGLILSGFHFYDGQNHQPDLAERQKAVDACEEQFYSIYQQLLEEGFQIPIVVFGGTPSMPCFASRLDRYSEAWLSPGTLFVGDYGYTKGLPDMNYPPAAAILTRVISHPQKNCFTLDLGTKGISTDQVSPGLLLGVEAAPLFQSEEHWVFQMNPGHEEERPPIGEILYVIPYHICPSTALYSDVVIVKAGAKADLWPVTARARKLTI